MSMESPGKQTVVPADTAPGTPGEPEQVILPEVAREHIRQLFFDNGNPRQEKELRQALQHVLGHLHNNLGLLDAVSREVINPHLEKMRTWLEAYGQAQLKKDVKTLGRLTPKLIEVQEQFLKELCLTIGYSPEQVVEIAAGKAPETVPQATPEPQPVPVAEAPVDAVADEKDPTRKWNEMVAKERKLSGAEVPPAPQVGEAKRMGDPQATTFAEEDYQGVSSYLYDPRQEEDERAFRKSQAAVRTPARDVRAEKTPAPEPAAAEQHATTREAVSPVDEYKQQESSAATEKTLEALQAQADRLIALTKKRREALGLSHAAAKEETDSYATVRSEISKIKNRLRAIEKGADEATKRAEIAALRSELASHLWALRGELETVPVDERPRSRATKLASATEAAPVANSEAPKKTGWWDKDFQAAHGVSVRSYGETAGGPGERIAAGTEGEGVSEVTPGMTVRFPRSDGGESVGRVRDIRDSESSGSVATVVWTEQGVSKEKQVPLRELSPYTGAFSLGDSVEVLRTNGSWTTAGVSEIAADGTYTVAWTEDGADFSKQVSVESLRKPTGLDSAAAAEHDVSVSEHGEDNLLHISTAIDTLLDTLQTATPKNTFIDGGPRQPLEVTLDLASIRASLKDLRNRIDDAATLTAGERDALSSEFADLSYRARKLIATAERIRPMRFYGVDIPVPGPEGVAAARALQAKLVEVRSRAEGQGDATAAAILREMWSHIPLIPPNGLTEEQVAKLRTLAPKVPESFRSPVEGVIAARSRSLPELPGLKGKEAEVQKDKAARRRFGLFGTTMVAAVLAALVADRQLDTDERVLPPGEPVAEGSIDAAAPPAKEVAGAKIELVDSYWPTAAAEASADDLFPEAGAAEPELGTEYRFTGERNAAGEVIDTVSEAAFEFWKQHPEVIEGPTLTKNEFLKAMYSVLDYAEKHPREKAELIDAMGLISGDFDRVDQFTGSNEAASTIDLAPLFAKIKAEVS